MSPNSLTAESAAGFSDLPRHIVLIGMMGAGKTTIGRRLAAILDRSFLDADHEIERAAGCTIQEIFAEHGEAAFREGERRVIGRLLDDEPPLVLATGGGAWMDPATRSTIGRNGVSVWLRGDIELLWRRVSRRGHRPLLRTADPRGTLERLVAERDPVYALADVTVDSTDRTPDAMARTVISALRDHARQPRSTV